MSHQNRFIFGDIESNIITYRIDTETNGYFHQLNNMNHACFGGHKTRARFTIFGVDVKGAQIDMRSLYNSSITHPFAWVVLQWKNSIRKHWGIVMSFHHYNPAQNDSTIEIKMDHIVELNAPTPSEIKWGELRSACVCATLAGENMPSWAAAWRWAGTDHEGEASPGELYLLAEAARTGSLRAALKAWEDAQWGRFEGLRWADTARLVRMACSLPNVDEEQRAQALSLLAIPEQKANTTETTNAESSNEP